MLLLLVGALDKRRRRTFHFCLASIAFYALLRLQLVLQIHFASVTIVVAAVVGRVAARVAAAAAAVVVVLAR